jgi:23S rRNA (cytidine1920-2'-O)/16S rRNA (cytidine1409-2'-O)-methyltransferase
LRSNKTLWIAAMKKRLDKYMVDSGNAATRSQAENYIKLGKVKVGGRTVTKPGYKVGSQTVELATQIQFVSRAALKLESAAGKLKLDFQGKTVLDIGSSTGGFSDFALRRGAKKVTAVDVGTGQMHPKLRGDKRVDLHERTDIRDFIKSCNQPVADMVLIDVSFISIREVLDVLPRAIKPKTTVVAMVKPQFETNKPDDKNKGIIKNENIRRTVLSEFESWAKKAYAVKDKADSQVRGEKGNQERFYKLALLKK